MFVQNRNLTDNYRNFTFIRTYFIVVQQQHSSSKTTQTERVGVGEAPNYFTFIFLISYLYNNTYYLFRTTTNKKETLLTDGLSEIQITSRNTVCDFLQVGGT